MRQPSPPVFDEIRAEFVADTEELLAGLETLIPAIRGPDRAASGEALSETFRRIHSLKGSAGMFGFPGVSTFCHEIEDYLSALRRRAADGAPEERDLGLLGRTICLLRSVFAGHEEGGALEALSAELRERRRSADSPRTTDSPRAAEPAAGHALADLALLRDEEQARLREVAERGEALVRFELRAPAYRFAAEFEAFTGRLVTPLVQVATLPTAEAAAGQVGMAVLAGGPADALDALAGQGGPAVASAQPVSLDAALAALGISPAAARETETEAATRSSDVTPLAGAGAGASLRVRLADLEALTDLAGELHLAAGAATGAVTRRNEREFMDRMQLVTRRAGELRRALLALRLVPIRPVLTRFHPIVQSLAWESKKEIELRVAGEETRVDRGVLEGLGEPLLHLVRNAVDHGLESPEERTAAGKRRSGLIVLEARAEGQQVTVEVRDDGRGVDRDRVERKARERGLLRPGLPRDEDLWRCLFAPGFTTRERATEISGRGVGLDVVRRGVLALQGLVEVISSPGGGTRVILRLPQTLALTRGLVIEQAGHRFIFPLHSIVGIRAAGRRGAEAFAERPAAREPMPLVHLGRFFGLGGAGGGAGDGPVVLAGVAEKRIGIVVERVVSQEEVLVRALGPLLAAHPGLAGAGELADGRLGLVVDIRTLVSRVRGESSARSGPGLVEKGETDGS